MFYSGKKKQKAPLTGYQCVLPNFTLGTGRERALISTPLILNMNGNIDGMQQQCFF